MLKHDIIIVLLCFINVLDEGFHWTKIKKHLTAEKSLQSLF